MIRRSKRARLKKGDPSEEKAFKLTRVPISPEELKEGKLSKSTLQLALSALKTAGAVVLQQIVKHMHLDELNKKMNADLKLRFEELSYNYSEGHLQLNPPRSDEFLYTDIVANPFVEQVARSYVHYESAIGGEAASQGEGPYLGAYSGNCNIGNSEDQPIHMDIERSMVQDGCRSLICNIPTVNTNEDNGAIELLLETQGLCGLAKCSEKYPMDKFGRGSIGAGLLKQMNPGSFVRACTDKGDVLLRDRRLWHRGKANSSKSPRMMVSLTYFPGIKGDGGPERVDFAENCKPKFEKSLFKNRLVYKAKVDHLSDAMISSDSLVN